MLRNAVRTSSPLGAEVAFDDATPILAQGVIDSLGIFSVMTELETRLNCTFPPEELVAENFQSIDVMEAMVQRLVQKGLIAEENVR
ncbi:MAG: phosphopantetheine-binding protein [Pseudomonadota bacterium]|jgi:acyl carrier protein